MLSLYSLQFVGELAAGVGPIGLIPYNFLLLLRLYAVVGAHEVLQVVQTRVVLLVDLEGVQDGGVTHHHPIAVGGYLGDEHCAVLGPRYQVTVVMGYFYLSDGRLVQLNLGVGLLEFYDIGERPLVGTDLSC